MRYFIPVFYLFKFKDKPAALLENVKLLFTIKMRMYTLYWLAISIRHQCPLIYCV